MSDAAAPTPTRGPIACSARVELVALGGIPVLAAGDDLAAHLVRATGEAGLTPRDGDVLVVASKAVSRAEGRFVDVSRVTPSRRARELARVTGKEPAVVELILSQSTHVSRAAPGVLVVRHLSGAVSANASIDFSNARPDGAEEGSGPWAILLPRDPDAAAASLRARLASAFGAAIGVVVSDSLGRPFRLGTVGAAVGVAGLPALWDRRGEEDLNGRALEHTITALADQVAAAADLVAGQAGEGRAGVWVRGLSFPVGPSSARDLQRDPDQDLYL